MNRIKLTAAVTLILLMLFSVFFGCSGSDFDPNEETTWDVVAEDIVETPEPGKDTVLVGANDFSDRFEEIFHKISDADTILFSEGDLIPDNTSAAFVYVSDADDAELVKSISSSGIPVVAFNGNGSVLPEDVVEIIYSSGCATETEAMDTAIAYPPHDTPVRMIGAFSREGSTADQVWNDEIAAGKVLLKGSYYGEPGESYEAWVRKMLKAYLEGMVDCAYVESPDLAVPMAEILVSSGRSDFEIFTVGTNDRLTVLASSNPAIFPAVRKTDEAKMLQISAEAVERILLQDIPDDIIISD